MEKNVIGAPMPAPKQEQAMAMATNPQIEGKYLNEAHKFTVYCDQNKRLYIEADLAVVFDIPDRGSIMINNTNCKRVTEEDISYIVSRSNGTLLPEYKAIELGNQREYAYAYATNETNIYNNNDELKTMLNDNPSEIVNDPTNIK